MYDSVEPKKQLLRFVVNKRQVNGGHDRPLPHVIARNETYFTVNYLQ